MDKGIIFKSLSGFYYVTDGKETVRCRARGRFRHENISPLVGDYVEITMDTKTDGVVDKILPRRNSFSRPPISNIDYMVIVVSEASPVTDPFLIDCMTAVASYSNVEVIICINKCDINAGEKLYEIYNKSGFKTFKVSAKTGAGIDELLFALKGKISVFTGNSGVGKSSILNRISPELSITTGEISKKLGRGRHTTRHVELMKISNNTFIGDTPGFSSFDTDRSLLSNPAELQYAFPDFAPYIDLCKFTGCSHTREKGCAVLQAVSNGSIVKSRHDSYVRIYAKQLEQYRPWEDKKSQR